MNTSEVLNKAADLIEERGWATGTGWVDHGSGLCLEGGILAALGRPGRYEEAAFRTCPAYVAVKRHLGPECRNAVTGNDDDDLWAWNDTVAESAAEVVEVLRAAALIEQARETTTTPAAEREGVSAK